MFEAIQTQINISEISSLAIIIFAALIHASLQLSVSVLTLLSGHSLGKKTTNNRVLRLMNSYIIGVMLITFLLLSAIAYYFTTAIDYSADSEQFIASIVCGLMFGLGVAIWAFYYRRGDGTSLWLPRTIAHYLIKHTKSTKNTAEAFALGMASVIAELLFISGPLMAATLAIISLPDVWWQLAGIVIYVVFSTISLLALQMAVSSGHNISNLQQWRENNKRFLQFVSGGSLLILATFLFVDRVLGISLYGIFQ